MSGRKKHEEEQGTFFCSVTHDLKLAEEMKKALPDFTSWAWIYHEPDTEEGTPHVHFLVRPNGTRKIKHVANTLGIDPQYVQVVRKVVAFRRYMLHLDNDEKIRYDLDDVHTNRRADFKSAIIGNDQKDITDLYREYISLSRGLITPSEFIQLNFLELQKMPFFQKIKMFEIISKADHRAHGTT